LRKSLLCRDPQDSLFTIQKLDIAHVRTEELDRGREYVLQTLIYASRPPKTRARFVEVCQRNGLEQSLYSPQVTSYARQKS
jgi:hypothetical protein